MVMAEEMAGVEAVNEAAATEMPTVVEDLEGAAKGAGEELSQCTCRRLYSRP